MTRRWGGASIATARGPSACWYNPALLGGAMASEFQLGFQWSAPKLSFRQDGGTGLAAARPPDYGGTIFGLTFPLGRQVAAGFLAHLPSDNLLRTSMVDPKTPHWYAFDSAPSRFVLVSALAVRVTSWLSLGAGVQLLAMLDGGADFELDLFRKEVVRRELGNDLGAVVAPTLGIRLSLLEGLELGASYRAEQQFDVAFPTRIELADVGVLDLDIRGVAHFTPHTFGVGASYTLEALRLTLAGALELQRWSVAPSPSLRLGVNLEGQTLEALGLGDALDLASMDGEPGFHDVLVPRAGIEYEATDWLRLRGGYFLRPTFVPDPTSASIFLDSHLHAMTLGAGVSFVEPLGVLAGPLSIDVTAQELFLRERGPVRRPDGSTITYGGGITHLSLAGSYRY